MKIEATTLILLLVIFGIGHSSGYGSGYYNAVENKETTYCNSTVINATLVIDSNLSRELNNPGRIFRNTTKKYIEYELETSCDFIDQSIMVKETVQENQELYSTIEEVGIGGCFISETSTELSFLNQNPCTQQPDVYKPIQVKQVMNVYEISIMEFILIIFLHLLMIIIPILTAYITIDALGRLRRQEYENEKKKKELN